MPRTVSTTVLNGTLVIYIRRGVEVAFYENYVVVGIIERILEPSGL